MEVLSRPFWQGAINMRSKVQSHNWPGVVLLVLFVTLMCLMQLDQQAITTSALAESQALDMEFVNLQRECRFWQGEVAHQASMEVLMAQAPQMSLYPPEQIVTVRVPAPQGAPHVPARVAPASVTGTRLPAGVTAPWWYDLVAGIEAWIRGEPQ